LVTFFIYLFVILPLLAKLILDDVDNYQSLKETLYICSFLKP